MDPVALRHLAVVSVTPGAFAQISLRKDPPVLVLTLRDILHAVDRCRGMHTLVVCTNDRRHWATLPVHQFMDRARTALGMQRSNSMPTLAALLTTLENRRLVSATMELPALDAQPPPPASLPAVRHWPAPHPYAFSSQLFWPSESVAPLGTVLFGTQALAAVADACRRSEVRDALPQLFGTPAALHALLSRSPFLPLLLAALATPRVRSRWVDARMVVGTPQLWAYVLHQLLLRAVDMYWPTDTLAARGIVGIPGLCVQPLPASRLVCMQLKEPVSSGPIRCEWTLDGTTTTLSQIESSERSAAVEPVCHPMVLNATFPHRIRLDAQCLWMPLDSHQMAAAVSSAHTGLPSQVVHDYTRDRLFVVAECALDEFIASRGNDAVLRVPIGLRRVCRHLAFYKESEPLPAGACVLLTRQWHAAALGGAPFVDGVPLVLVDLAPGEHVDRHARLAPDRVPRRWWPLVSADTLLHPLRSAPESHRLKVNGHWWCCSQPGAAVCLDPEPQLDELRATLGLNARHSPPYAAAPTGVFLCAPPALAAMPAPVPRWHRCRLGCRSCAVSNAVAHSGDSAVLCRQELACVLWWHWQRFAEFILCVSPRAATLGPQWFQLECWALKDALACGADQLRAVTPPLRSSLDAPLRSSSSVTGAAQMLRTSSCSIDSTQQLAPYRSAVKLRLRDNSEWEVSAVVSAAAARCTNDMEPLLAHTVYLLWCINDSSAQEYGSWVRVGRQLYQLDPDSGELRFAWQWWSRRYGGDKYKEERDFATGRQKWDQLASSGGNGGELAMCMRVLASMAKRAGGDTLTYARDAVDRALTDFWDEGRAWWGGSE